MKECSNCRYVHEETKIKLLQCYGQKNAPIVYSDDVCDSWKPKEDSNGWISANEILPDEMADHSIAGGWSEAVRPTDDVLVYLRLERRQTVAWYSYVSKTWMTVDECREYGMRDIVAWRTLPEPPKEVIRR